MAHLDAHGRPIMVDVSGKSPTDRSAKASGCVHMSTQTLTQILSATTSKGNVCQIAELAGITGAKQTSSLIPLCHPLPLTALNVQIQPDQQLPGLQITAIARTNAQTGVEMEALTAVSIACLTIYDMLKSIDRNMQISQIMLLEKSGGQSGKWKRTS